MQRAKVSNHPCHRLSVPAAKRFWCRHCMMVFEDAITRWRHSRSCRSGGFDNFIRRREIETQALQKMAETLDPDMMALSPGDAVAGCSKELCCFICRQRFLSLDEMREHVKYPCNKPANLPRPSMTVYIEEPTFGTGIQQHFTDGPGLRASANTSNHSESGTSTGTNPVAVYMDEGDQGHSQGEAKPTNIYVNEKGETVIEVENLDLNTKSGELSLAHLLTQLSQQGIVFDQQGPSEPDNSMAPSGAPVIHGTLQELDLGQPTAVDAANTLTQLAGSAYRAASYHHNEEIYSYAPPVKRIKSECIEVQYPSEQHYQPEQESQALETVVHRDGMEVSAGGNYIICTDESEVISVVRADTGDQDASSDGSSSAPVFQGGSLVITKREMEEASPSDETSGAEHYTIVSQQSEFQQSFSGTDTASQHTAGGAEALQSDSQVVEYAVSSQPNVSVLPSLNHLVQLDVSAVQAREEGLVEEHQVMQPGEVLEQSSTQLEAALTSSGLEGDSTTAEHTTPLEPDSRGGQQQFGGDVSGRLESSVLPQIVSVSTAPHVSIASVHQTRGAGAAVQSPENLLDTCDISSSLPNQLIVESQEPEKSAAGRLSGKDNIPGSKHNDSSRLSFGQKERCKEPEERRVTRSVSVVLQNQRTRCLRSRSLPDCTVPKRPVHRLIPECEKRSQSPIGPDSAKVTDRADKVRSIQEQIQLVRESKKLSNLQKAHLPLYSRGSSGELVQCSSHLSFADIKPKQEWCQHESFIKDLKFGSAKSDRFSREKTMLNSSREYPDVDDESSVSQDLQSTDLKRDSDVSKTRSVAWTESALVKRVSSRERQYKCVVCGRTFGAHQQLQKHRQVPCRVQLTRRMSQKVLRPRSSIIHKPICKPKKRCKEQMKPKQHIPPLLLWRPIRREKSLKKHSIFSLICKAPLFQADSSEPQIRLYGKNLNISSLGRQEKFLMTFGLVQTMHIPLPSLAKHQLMLRSRTAVKKERQKEAETRQASLRVIVPQTVTVHSDSCQSSPDIYGPPPLLEPIDLTSMSLDNEDVHDMCSEPPILEMFGGPRLGISEPHADPPSFFAAQLESSTVEAKKAVGGISAGLLLDCTESVELSAQHPLFLKPSTSSSLQGTSGQGVRPGLDADVAHSSLAPHSPQSSTPVYNCPSSTDPSKRTVNTVQSAVCSHSLQPSISMREHAAHSDTTDTAETVCCSHSSQPSSTLHNSILSDQAEFISDSQRPVTRITIKSLAGGLRLADGGKIIIRTSQHRDKILIINPEDQNQHGESESDISAGLD